MHIYNNTMLVSLGSNCPTEGVVKRMVETYDLPLERKSGFFDWLIVSPKSILQAFRLIKEGKLLETVIDRSNYVQVKSIKGETFIKNKAFDCLYVWHTGEYDSEFAEKTKHKINNLLNYDGKIIFILKNTHIQIIENMLSVKEDPTKFLLLYEDYLELCSLAKELFNAEIVLRSDAEMTLGFPIDTEFNIHEPQLEDIKEWFSL